MQKVLSCVAFTPHSTSNLRIMDRKVIFIHLLNDFSGSPRVLSQVIEETVKQGTEAELYTAGGQEGFLSNLKGVQTHTIPYQWHANKLLTLFAFIWSQVVLFAKLLQYRKQNTVFYINTVLPFGAALAAKLMNKPVIYHVHETSLRPLLLKRFLFGIAQITATQAIYVSHFLQEKEPLKNVESMVVHNALANDFLQKSRKANPRTNERFQVLMLASLKVYKGIFEFVELARQLPQTNFELVLNASAEEINNCFQHEKIPSNLTLFPSQSDVHPFYQRANLVLNLSHPEQWVETFGLTALEAISYGIPAIVPPAGGIQEIIDHQSCGFQLDVRQLDSIVSTITRMQENEVLYKKLCKQAKIRAIAFDPQQMMNSILPILERV